MLHIMYMLQLYSSKIYTIIFQVTHKVWFDVTIGGEAAGRIEVGLFGKTVPKVRRDLASSNKGFYGWELEHNLSSG